MKLLTKKIIKALPSHMSTNTTSLENRIVICKFFMPHSSWNWFVFEGEQDNKPHYDEEIDYIFFGMVYGVKRGLRYFKLSELSRITSLFRLPVERDPSIFKKKYWECR
tara:strand:+ start:58 stop:381 length:324 start_codon:yes stop_codon:yes gene_type:complete